jgi:two-component system phosphate regulon sensor histidine kinase PhoR
MLYLAIPLGMNGSSINAVLRTSLFVQEINSLIKDIRTQILVLAAVLLFLSLIVIFLVSKSISNPIKKIVQASRRVSEGDYEVQVFNRDKGEIGELTRSFNEMVNHQKQLFARISNSREELQTIVGSMKEGLMVVNLNGEILLTNNSFDQIINSPDSEGKKYWEVCRNTDFYDFMNRIIDEKINASGQLGINGKIYITSFNFISGQQRIVITFHDISKIKQLETIKKDFVTNVSHELKTPLTSIKGFIETLESENKDSNPVYLNIIKRNTDRLINIVHDLLLLSNLEDKVTSLKKQDVDVRKLLDQLILPFEPMLKRKNLKFKLQADKSLPSIKADLFKLEDLFVNLLDNAIKYTEEGEITIKLSREQTWLRCDIIDTGIGIPNKQQDRIFERFFVLDPSRSKASGGTGLGLSIVKHIVMMHGGTIEVNSTVNQGSTFTVRLPLN